MKWPLVSPPIISTAHVLLRATAVALARHQDLNRRVVGRRVYAYRQANVRMAFRNPRRGDVDVVLIERDRRRMHRLPALAFHALVGCYGWPDRTFPLPTLGRLDRLRAGVVLVNDLSFRRAPAMRTYKPTRFPDESATLHVTLGPMEEKVTVQDGEIVASTVAPLFVRADHCITDAYGLGKFLATLRGLLEDPASMESCGNAASGNDGKNRSKAA